MSHARDVKVTKISLKLDRERTLKFDLNAFIELEDKYGSVQSVLDKVQQGSIKAMRDALWAGLIHEDPSLTPEQVGVMVNVDNLPAVAAALVQAVGGALPEGEEGGEETPGNPLTS